MISRIFIKIKKIRMANKIPTIESIVNGTIDGDDFQKAMRQQPPKEWVEVHPEDRYEYLPIGKVDRLLEGFFEEHTEEVVSLTPGQNSVHIVFRLGVKHPMTDKWIYRDGVGAADTRREGFERAAALAKANAKKNAAKELGEVFGRSLSRETEKKERSETKPSEELKKEETGINPVATRIVKQMYACRSETGFKNTVAAFYERAKAGEVDADDPKIMEAMNNKAEKLGITLNNDNDE